VRSNKAYAIETATDGSKTVHSFTSRKLRDAWVTDNPATRIEASSQTKTVSAAIYTESVVAH
jgi:hypothetical protein